MGFRRSLRTILFTDIVGSTKRASEMGDRSWRDLQGRHHGIVREELARWAGFEATETGDGFMALFDDPARGIVCAHAIRERVRDLGLEIRAGLHLGQTEQDPDGSVGGIAVHIAARVANEAGPGEIVVTSAVRDAEAGSGFEFEDLGYRPLKGVVREWRLFRISGIPESAADLAPGRWERMRRRLGSRRVGGVAAIVLVALGMGGWYLLAGERAEATDRSIAVLPFETIGESADPTFTEGIHGDVLTRLSGLSGLDVISRTSVMRYRDREKSPPEIAEELGVAWVLQGEVQQVGDRVQVNARLVDAREDRQVWAENYGRELTAANVFEIQRQITLQIVGALETRLTREEEAAIASEPTGDLEAYRLYVHGRGLLDQRTEASMRLALEYFQRAVARDSSYALAWAGFADALGLLKSYGHPLPDDAPAPRRAARRALELNPELAEAHASLGVILVDLERNGPAAIRELMRAVELRPSYADAHNWLSWVYQLLGRPVEALESARRAVELNPLGPEPLSNLSLSYMENGAWREGLDEARRTREIQSDFTTGPFYEALALYHMERFREAESALRGLSVPWAGSGTHDLRTSIQVASGEIARVRERLARLEAEAENPFSAGLVHAALGEEDEAFEAFLRVERWDHWPTLALRYFFPDILDPLREDPRYNELLEALNRDWGLQPDGSFPGDG
ncbi:MAG: tetratricopeptide repeat protein [Gemmatimonadetes bacterium]|nr:tetratricopeptide repeat protein [Gemmatimonadota bacterium]